MTRVYLAGPFFNPTQLALVQDIERCIKSFHGLELYSPRQDGIVLQDLSPEDRKAVVRKVFQTNVDEIEKADLILAIIDGRDTGTIWEMGYAFGKGKSTITYSDEGYGVNVMLAGCTLAHVKGKQHLCDVLADVANMGIAGLLRHSGSKLEANT